MTNANGEYLYLVQGIIEDEPFARIMTAREIFDMEDMSDCYSLEYDLYALDGYGMALRECYVYGKWTYPGDPQRMRIMYGGEAIETGLGTDH